MMKASRTDASVGRPKASVAAFAGLVSLVLVAPLVAPMASAVVGAPDESGDDFVARLDIGDGQRACTGALVAPLWVLTAASCFVEDPAAGLDVPIGPPDLATTVTIGRADLSTDAGLVRDVVELVPHESRDLVMVQLSGAATGVNPIPVAVDEPTAGEELRVSGYGRTATEWAPLRRHVGTFVVDSVAGSDVAMTGQDGAAVCAGDTGGPALRTTGDGVELVAVNSRSWQGGCFGADPAETRTSALNTRVDDIHDWIDRMIWREDWADYNCDGIRDLAVGDPKATVNGMDEAGLVRVIYGGSGENVVITQDSSGVGETAEANDHFGSSLATYDRNQDGCSDLAIGTPDEDRNGHANAGLVQVIHGAPGGLLNGPGNVAYRQGAGTGAFASATEEANDKVAFSLAAGNTVAGIPYLLIGAPGKDIGNATNAGAVFYVHGDDPSVVLTQSDSGLRGASEPSDLFGYSVTADSQYLAIGAPGETLSGVEGSGYVHVLRQPAGAGLPREVAALSQDSAGVSDSSDTDDRFGHSLDIASFPSRDEEGHRDSVLAVGSPGENVGTSPDGAPVDAGRAVTFQIRADGTWNELYEYHHGIDGVDGTPSPGDRFGDEVAVANLASGFDASPTSVVLAVGSPGDAEGGAAGSGSISVFSAVDSPAEFQRLVYAGNGLPGEPDAGASLGGVLTAIDSRLYVGVPDGPSTYGQVHSVPWGQFTGTPADEPLITYQPGAGGLSAKGMSFGVAIN